MCEVMKSFGDLFFMSVFFGGVLFIILFIIIGILVALHDN